MILKFNTYNFLKESYTDFNQFSQMGMGPSPLPDYGFATDPSLSIYGSRDSQYVSDYYRKAHLTSSLLDIINQVNKEVAGSGIMKFDHFLEDINEIDNLKILRINKNENLKLNIYISFEIEDIEYFGVYKNFNHINPDKLKCELFTDPDHYYIDEPYVIKMDNYLRNILNKWFVPEKGEYVNLNNNLRCRNNMGENIHIKLKSVINVTMTGTDKDGDPYIKFKLNDEQYVINKNDYYFFKYWFDNINV
jgi:hypothetical protein